MKKWRADTASKQRRPWHIIGPRQALTRPAPPQRRLCRYCLAAAAPARAARLPARPRMCATGETIVVGSLPIRLNGLAAPEWG